MKFQIRIKQLIEQWRENKSKFHWKCVGVHYAECFSSLSRVLDLNEWTLKCCAVTMHHWAVRVRARLVPLFTPVGLESRFFYFNQFGGDSFWRTLSRRWFSGSKLFLSHLSCLVCLYWTFPHGVVLQLSGPVHPNLLRWTILRPGR